MDSYIDKAKLVGEVLTNSEQQLRFRQMTGTEAYYEFLRLVNDAPAADVAPVAHGEWKQFRFGTDDYALRLKCSCCREVVYERSFRFCPYCGAQCDLGGPDNDQL